MGTALSADRGILCCTLVIDRVDKLGRVPCASVGTCTSFGRTGCVTSLSRLLLVISSVACFATLAVFLAGGLRFGLSGFHF